MKTNSALMLTAFVLIAPVVGAQPVTAPKGGAVISSSPGKAAAAATVEVTAVVTAINKGTRTVTLKGPQGRSLDVVAGAEVKNFDQIKIGDNVVVQYLEALSLELKKKSQAKPQAKASVTASDAAVHAAPGERPAGAAGREVVVLADVVAVDPVKSTISLKGPAGKVVVLNVQNPDHFKVVKVGDQVEAVYTEAIAIAVKPAPKVDAKK
jgi:hypothetical protein